LQADAKDIEVIEADSGQRWGRINIGEGTGWVSLAYLSRQPDDRTGAMPAIRSCHGTEPFWSLSLDGAGGARFTTPDSEPRTGAVLSRQSSLNRADRHGFSARLGEAEVTAIVAQSLCSDGMSDRAFGLTIDLVLDGGSQDSRLLSGCCSLLP
jgi:uncharacterized membrane protein